MNPVRSILFVCSGNTCRSPMAEGILRALAKERGIRLEIASAGTSGGGMTAENAIAAASKHGADIGAHQPKNLTLEMAGRADLVLTMADHHLGAQNLKPYKGRTAFRFRDYAFPDTPAAARDVEDPYMGSIHRYEACAAEIREASSALLDRLEREGRLEHE